jgi:hypothetical protein
MGTYGLSHGECAHCPALPAGQASALAGRARASSQQWLAARVHPVSFWIMHVHDLI